MEHTPGPVVVAVPQGDVDAALRFSVREAGLHGRGLRLVHVCRAPQEDADALVDVPATHAAAARTLELAMEHATTLVPGGTDLTAALVHGPVAQAVVDASADATMLVLQPRGLPQLMRTVTRSTSRAIAAHAHVPVASVPATWHTDLRDPRSVTVAVDIPQRSRPILLQGLAEARRHRARLRVLHTWQFPDGYDDLITSRVGVGDLDAKERDAIERVLADLDPNDVDVPIDVEVHHGEAREALLESAHRSQLLVLGRHDVRLPAGSPLGPVASTVLGEASCPVLLVPLHPAAEARPQPDPTAASSSLAPHE